MNRSSTLILGLVLFAALATLCLGTGAPAIQARVLECTQSGLREAGLAGIVTRADGRDVTLSGPGAVASVEGAAAEVARGCGARVVVGSWSGEGSGAYSTSLCLSPGRVELVGSVPDASVRSELTSALEARTGASVFDGELGVRGGAPPGYEAMLERSAVELVQLDEGCIELRDRDLLVSGSIRSQTALDGLRERVEAVAGPDYRTSFDVAVPDLSESAVACQEAYRELLGAGARVLFDFDSSELHQEGRALLDTVEGIWEERCPDVSILVTGHTDNVGDPAYNRTLSTARAQAVVDYLVEQGFDPEKLTAVGYGETQPRASNDTEEGRTQNRRIEFRIVETEG